MNYVSLIQWHYRFFSKIHDFSSPRLLATVQVTGMVCFLLSMRYCLLSSKESERIWGEKKQCPSSSYCMGCSWRFLINLRTMWKPKQLVSPTCSRTRNFLECWELCFLENIGKYGDLLVWFLKSPYNTWSVAIHCGFRQWPDESIWSVFKVCFKFD